jgi:hypothetical protein
MNQNMTFYSYVKVISYRYNIKKLRAVRHIFKLSYRQDSVQRCFFLTSNRFRNWTFFCTIFNTILLSLCLSSRYIYLSFYLRMSISLSICVTPTASEIYFFLHFLEFLFKIWFYILSSDRMNLIESECKNNTQDMIPAEG